MPKNIGFFFNFTLSTINIETLKNFYLYIYFSCMALLIEGPIPYLGRRGGIHRKNQQMTKKIHVLKFWTPPYKQLIKQGLNVHHVTLQFSNLLNYTVMALGNHDFDDGTSGLQPFVKQVSQKLYMYFSIFFYFLSI